MQRMEMTAEFREKRGKGAARSVRRTGMIPAVMYASGESTSLVLDPADVAKVLRSGAGENALITLKIRGMGKNSGGSGSSAEERLTILRDIQLDPLNGKVLHEDLFEISLDKMIRVRVPTEVIGQVPAGVKEGGVLQHPLREVELECLPMSIPDRLQVDASELKIGEAIYLRDLNLGEGIRLLGHGDQVVVSIAAPISQEKLDEMLTATAKEAQEPEVIAKGKEAEGEAAKPEAKAGGESAGAAAKPKKEEGK